MRLPLGVVILVMCGAQAIAAPRDFTTETRAMFAVAACGEPAPAAYDRATVKAHCLEVKKIVEGWRKNWRDKAVPYVAKLVGTPPTTIVYPFGGGDVVSMLALFPDATEYTSLSLEGIGDPRPLANLAGAKGAAKLAANLASTRKAIAENLVWAWNMTIDLSKESDATGAGVPNILALALVALDANGYEPVEVRYFELAADGSVVYLTQERVDTWDADHKNDVKGKPKHPKAVQRGLFNNVEIVFRKQGDANAPKKTFRHIAADLSDEALAKDGSAIAYLDKRPGFGSMTKAASYLFWRPGFDKVRAVFLARMKMMVSDDTGLPPRWAKPAGFKQDVYGTYLGSFFNFPPQDIAKEMVELWKSSTTKTIPFRFGYYDNKRNPHLMYTYK